MLVYGCTSVNQYAKNKYHGRQSFKEDRGMLVWGLGWTMEKNISTILAK